MLVALDILEMLDLLNLLDMLDIYHGWSFKSLRFEREVGLLIHCLTAKKRLPACRTLNPSKPKKLNVSAVAEFSGRTKRCSSQRAPEPILILNGKRVSNCISSQKKRRRRKIGTCNRERRFDICPYCPQKRKFGAASARLPRNTACVLQSKQSTEQK